MSPRVLVVDDDPTILRTLRFNLRARSYEVEAVTNGRDALAAFAAEAPDLVVLDLGLPDLDGVEVLRRIRSTSRVPVVVLSARHESDDKVEAFLASRPVLVSGNHSTLAAQPDPTSPASLTPAEVEVAKRSNIPLEKFAAAKAAKSKKV